MTEVPETIEQGHVQEIHPETPQDNSAKEARKEGVKAHANRLEGSLDKQKLYKSFEDFYQVIDGKDNINTAFIHDGRNDYLATYNYVKQLLERTGLASKVYLAPQDRAQVGIYVRNGNIEISVLGHYDGEKKTFSRTQNQQTETNSSATFVITPDFKVVENFEPYTVPGET